MDFVGMSGRRAESPRSSRGRLECAITVIMWVDSCGRPAGADRSR